MYFNAKANSFLLLRASLKTQVPLVPSPLDSVQQKYFLARVGLLEIILEFLEMPLRLSLTKTTSSVTSSTQKSLSFGEGFRVRLSVKQTD